MCDSVFCFFFFFYLLELLQIITMIIYFFFFGFYKIISQTNGQSTFEHRLCANGSTFEHPHQQDQTIYMCLLKHVYTL